MNKLIQTNDLWKGVDPAEYYFIERLEEILKNTQTVDPYKHGHWTDRAQSILGVPMEACSECAEWSLGFDKDYCPCCGAKMDEVGKDVE